MKDSIIEFLDRIIDSDRYNKIIMKHIIEKYPEPFYINSVKYSTKVPVPNILTFVREFEKQGIIRRSLIIIIFRIAIFMK